MPNGSVDSQIRARIEDFVAELSDLVHAAALESVQNALAGAGLTAPVKRGPGRPKGSGRKKPGRKPGRKPGKKAARRAAPKAGSAAVAKTGRRGGKRIRRSAGDLAEAGQAILLIVKDNPGIRSEEIRKALRVDAKDLKRPIDMLLASRKLRTEGQKRGTRYFAGSGGGRTVKPTTKKKATRKRATKKTAKKAAKKAGKKPVRRKKAAKRVTKKKSTA